MGQAYSQTEWVVKEGHEEEFVQLWLEFVDWSSAQGLRAKALLLRDIDDPLRFISFGPWEGVDAIRSWRALPGFQERVASLHRVVDQIEPHALEVVAESGGSQRRLRAKRSA